jgi:hypothetical protein
MRSSEKVACVCSSHLPAPPGYHDLCDKLQTENDPARFRLLVDQLNRLLTAYEKSGAREEHTQE